MWGKRMEGTGYSAAAEHMEELFGFLDRLLYAAFCQKRGSDYENLSMRGLVITEKEIDQAFGLLRRSESLPADEAADLAGIGIEIERKERRTEIFLPFFSICYYFDLNALEKLALLVAAAPCFHRKYDRIYGYLQDDVELSAPTRGLCLSLGQLMGELPEEEQAEFLSGSGNFELLLGPGRDRGRGLEGTIGLSQRIRNYLHEIAEPDPLIRDRLRIFDWREPLEPMLVREELLERLEKLMEGLEREPDESAMILLCGRDGIGKQFLLRHLARRRESFLLYFDMDGLLYEKPEKARELVEAVLVEAVLCKGLICLEGLEDGREAGEEGGAGRPGCRREILSFLSRRVPCFFLAAEEKEDQMAEFPGKKLCVELPPLGAGEKVRLWKAFGKAYELQEDVDLEANGNKYVLTPQGIRDVLATARLLAYEEGTAGISQEHIRQAVRQNQKNQLGAYATQINSCFQWDDLILGEEQKRQMRMVCDQMKYRDVVGEKWGFYKKTSYGRGLSVLFYGPPGTGKTMAAQVMANELGLDLYRIDISQMISKYIGETQKNISRLFQKAKDINALLFFDEADSLFAKRSEAKDSHDRNANAETAHLLQKLEDYEGITVLATNYLNNIDDAFKRRIKFIIRIAFPPADVRLTLWKSMLPPQVEYEEELDLEFFAEHFELSGSSIKEILVNAAYMAAAEHRGLANRDLVEAVKLNYLKYEKLLTKEDFEYLG